MFQLCCSISMDGPLLILVQAPPPSNTSTTSWQASRVFTYHHHMIDVLQSINDINPAVVSSDDMFLNGWLTVEAGPGDGGRQATAFPEDGLVDSSTERCLCCGPPRSSIPWTPHTPAPPSHYPYLAPPPPARS